MTEADLAAVYAWLERHLVETKEEQDDARRQGDRWLLERRTTEWLQLAHLQTEVATVMREVMRD